MLYFMGTLMFEPIIAGTPQIIASIQITIAVAMVVRVARFPPPANILK